MCLRLKSGFQKQILTINVSVQDSATGQKYFSPVLQYPIIPESFHQTLYPPFRGLQPYSLSDLSDRQPKVKSQSDKSMKLCFLMD